MSRLPIGPLTKFLVFAVVTALATTVLGLTIANSRGGSTVEYSARFTDATGLLPGDDVRIAGVVVGSVTDISVVDQRVAKVDFNVDSSQQLPITTDATIKYRNLIGQRYVALDQGTGPTGQLLPEGGVIPLERTRPALNLTVLFNGFQPLFQGLDPNQINKLSMEIVQVLQGEGGTVQSLLASTASLTNSVADRDQVIGQVITNLNEVLQTVNANDQGLNELISSLQALVSGLSQDRKPIGDAITSIGTLTQVTGDFLGDARPAIKDDVRNLGDLATELDKGRPAVEKFLQYTPFKLNRIGRVGSYGSWFQFYLCGLSGSVGLSTPGLDGQPLLPPTEIPLYQNQQRRCGSDPSGLGPGGTAPTDGNSAPDNRAAANPAAAEPGTSSLDGLLGAPQVPGTGRETDSSADPAAPLQPLTGGN